MMYFIKQTSKGRPHEKAIQIIIVILLILMSYMLGRLSMKEDLSALTNRIYQLEIDIINLTNEINESNEDKTN